MDSFVSRKVLRKQKKQEKKDRKQAYFRQRQMPQVPAKTQQKPTKPILPKKRPRVEEKIDEEITSSDEEPVVVKKHAQKKKVAEPGINKEENLEEIDKLNNEIEYLEKMLGAKNTSKKSNLNKRIEQEGLGVGFLDFLDDVQNKIRNPLKKQDYAFNDEEQEVLLDEADLAKMLQVGGGEDDDHQHGFSDQESFDSGNQQSSSGDEDSEEDGEEEGEEDGEEGEMEDDEPFGDYGEEDAEEAVPSKGRAINPDSLESSSVEDDLVSDADSDIVKVHNFEQSSSDEEEGEASMEDEESGEGSFEEEESAEEDVEGSDNEATPEPTKPSLDLKETEKKIRSILNKVSEGNIDPMFKQLTALVDELISEDQATFIQAYSAIFIQLTINLQQQMNAILSVNCVYVVALQRLYGPAIFANIARRLFEEFSHSHQTVSNADPEEEDDDVARAKTKLKNVLNCFLHFFLFRGMTASLLFDLIRTLLDSFKEEDIEVLIFLLHNIGLQLRKEDPVAIKSIIELADQKKSSFGIQIKMAEKEGEDEDVLDQMRKRERKMKFLQMELTDIKNNKGSTTLQVRSIDHLQVWLKRDTRLQSELNIKPLALSSDQMKAAKDLPALGNWWGSEGSATVDPKAAKKNARKKNESVASQIEQLAKAQHMTTDIKKAVFEAIMSATDFQEAYENCSRLNLKKQQEREIIKVTVQCCVNESGFNRYYALLVQRFIRENPQSFRYSFKFTLWDYLKQLQNFEINQVSNLARLTGFLISRLEAPLHFLKLIDFSGQEDDDKFISAKPPQVQLFCFLLFDSIFKELSDHKEIAKVFDQGLPENFSDFGKSLSEYLLTKFYSRLKKQHGGKLEKELQRKLKVAFSVIKKKTENEFVASALSKTL